MCQLGDTKRSPQWPAMRHRGRTGSHPEACERGPRARLGDNKRPAQSPQLPTASQGLQTHPNRLVKQFHVRQSSLSRCPKVAACFPLLFPHLNIRRQTLNPCRQLSVRTQSLLITTPRGDPCSLHHGVDDGSSRTGFSPQSTAHAPAPHPPHAHNGCALRRERLCNGNASLPNEAVFVAISSFQIQK